MSARTDIANLALTALEQPVVENIDNGGSTAADLILAVWDTMLDFALAAHPWHFARWNWKNQPSLPAAQNPSIKYRFAYQRPPDLITVSEVGGCRDDSFEAIAALVCCDSGPSAHITGTRRIVEPGRYTIWFVNYFAAVLADRIAKPLSASEAIKQSIKKDMQKALDDARSASAGEGAIQSPFADTWMDAYWGGDGSWI